MIRHTLGAFLAWPRTAKIVAVIHPDDVALFEDGPFRLRAQTITVCLAARPASNRFWPGSGCSPTPASPMR